MPAPALMDLGSGMDTKGTIDKLMELERIPIQRLQKKNQVELIRISAWGEVRKRTQELQNRSHTLQSFSGSFAINEVTSSDPGAITGQAIPDINPGKQQIEVVQLATFHSLHSNPLDLTTDLPAGKFKITVNKKTIDFEFSGGKPRALLNHLKIRGLSILELHGVQLDSQNLMIALRSKFTGKAGKIEFEDQDGLLTQIGLASTKLVEEKKLESKDLVFEKNKIKQIALNPSDKNLFKLDNNDSVLEINKDGKLIWQKNLAQDSIVELTYSISKREESEPKAQKEKKQAGNKEDTNQKENSGMTIGPDIGIKVGDVSLEGYNIKRKPVTRDQSDNDDLKNKNELKKNKVAQIKIGVMWDDNGKEKEKYILKKLGKDLNPQDGKLKLSINSLTGGKKAKAIWFENSGTLSRFSQAILKDTVTKKTNEPVNETTKAQDAIIKVNGVEVKRSKNKGLTDIIEGVNLDLNRVTAGPIIVSIETKSDEIVNEIKTWVASYNDLLGFCREISKSQKNDLNPQVDSNGKIKDYKQSGLFANDSTIRQLVTRVRTQTSSSFPIISNDGYRVLSDIGISTGDVGQNWEDIKAGKLHLNEEKLRKVLASNPEGVRNLFASDTNEDNIKESGIAVAMLSLLKPYNRKAGGLISSRIDMIKDSIKSNKDEMYKKELSLKSKENTLRRKFGRMERLVRQNKSIGNFLKGQNRQRN